MTNEFFEDPDFPNRPQHGDFWKMAAATNKADAYISEDGMSLESALEHIGVDIESLIYMAKNRVVRALQFSESPSDSLLLSIWVDAFIAGVLFERGD